MKKLIVSLLLATASVPALAWGEREQGILAGIAGTILLQNITRGDANIQIAPQVVVPYQPYHSHYPYYQHNRHNHYRHYPRVDVYPYIEPRGPVCYWTNDARVDRHGNIFYVPRRACP